MDLDNIQRKYGLPAPLPVVQNGKFATRFPLNLEHRGDDVFQFGGKYIGEIENIYDLLYKILTNQEIDASLALPYAIKITEDKLYIRDKTNSEWILIFDITKPNFPKEIELYELIYKAITHQVIGEDTSYPGQFKIEENILYVRDKDNLTWTQIGDVTKEFLGATEATQAILERVNEILIEVQELKTELNRQIATTNETLTIALQAANEAMTSAQSINIRTFNSVEEMKASNTLKAGALAITQGFYTAGDGGGADYVIVDDIGEDEADEASIIALQNGLYAKLLIHDVLNIKQIGAYGDGIHDDTEAVQKAVDYANEKIMLTANKKDIYNLSKPITITTCLFADFNFATFKAIENLACVIEIDTGDSFYGGLTNINIDVNSKADVGLLLTSAPRKILENIVMININKVGIKHIKGSVNANNIWLNGDRNSKETIGIMPGTDSNYNNIVMQDCITGIYVNQAGNISYFNNIHPWIGNPENLEGSKAIHLVDGAVIVINNFYPDTYDFTFYSDSANTKIFANGVDVFINSGTWNASSIVDKTLYLTYYANTTLDNRTVFNNFENIRWRAYFVNKEFTNMDCFYGKVKISEYTPSDENKLEYPIGYFLDYAPNLLLNGSFDIWDNGTTFTNIGETANLWILTGNGSIERCYKAGATSDLNTNSFYLKPIIEEGQYISLSQVVRYGVNRLKYRPVTLSFKAKAEEEIKISTGLFLEKESGERKQIGSTINVTLTTNWNKIECNFLISKNLATYDNAYPHLRVVFTTNQSVGINIGEVKLEANPRATLFLPQNYNMEKVLCAKE